MQKIAFRRFKACGEYRSRTGDLFPECFRGKQTLYPDELISHSIYFLLFFFFISNSLFLANSRELNFSIYASTQSFDMAVKSEIPLLCCTSLFTISSVWPT